MRRTVASREGRARSSPVPDVIASHLDVLFVGINPGFASARAHHHFANPANGFWRLLHDAGFTDRQLAPAEERELLGQRIGLTNLVGRESAGVAELGREDFDRGRLALLVKVRRLEPKAVVFVGITAYRAFRPTTHPITCGEQPETIVPTVGNEDWSVTIEFRVEADLLESCAFGLIYVLGLLSFHDGRPRGISGKWFEDDDEFTAADMIRHLKFERGTLKMYVDYLRGRCIKTDVEVASDGRVFLKTVNRGHAATRWVERLKGKQFLRAVEA